MVAKIYMSNLELVIDILKKIILSAVHDSRSGDHCFCMRCRQGGGKYEVCSFDIDIQDDEDQEKCIFTYETGSGLGFYYFFPSFIVFKGLRNSFKVGTEFFDNKSFETEERKWVVIESTQPERGVWE